MSRARRPDRPRSLALASLLRRRRCDPASTRRRVCSIPRCGSARSPTEHFVIYFHQGEDRLARAAGRRSPKRPGRRCGSRSASCRRGARTSCSPIRPISRTARPRRCRTTPSSSTPCGRRAPTSSATSTTGCGSCSPTSSRTSSISIARKAGRASSRSIFGRTPLAFPNLFLPAWQIEGLATYEESAITGTGRLHAGDFRAIVGEAARAARLEPLDRVNGGLTDWPGGTARVRLRRWAFISIWPTDSGPRRWRRSPRPRQGACPTRRRARSSGSTASRSARCGASTRRAPTRGVAAAPPASAGTSVTRSPTTGSPCGGRGSIGSRAQAAPPRSSTRRATRTASPPCTASGSMARARGR